MTKICATCGCSLVRLGISNQQSVHYQYGLADYYFCCQGCLGIFVQDPEKYLQETSNIVVCPTCLAEKPKDYMVKLIYKTQTLYFCRCPYCLDTFNKDPEKYLFRLTGESDFKGLFSDDENACCH